jgi:hypothetical protein
VTESRPLRLPGPAGRLARALTISLLLTGALTGIGPAAASAATCQAWTGLQPPSPGTQQNEFNGVTVLSPCDAWAVGSDEDSGGLEQTLIEHWDGTAWTVVPSPNVAGFSNVLGAVRAVSPTDVWAVGDISATGVEQTLVLHWDGHTWAQVASPSPGTMAALSAVRTVSATDAWAVGFFDNGSGDRPLILHWNGHQWAQVASPHPGIEGGLSGVAAVSASNAWAVGAFFNGTAERSLTLHWNGHQWAQVASPNPGGPARDTILNGVAAGTATGKVWAVGWYSKGATDNTLILAWTGKAWVQQASPSPGDSFLFNAVTTAADNTWAVGDYDNGTTLLSLILYWNGTKWARVASPNPGSSSSLYAVAASSATNVWAVGRFIDDIHEAFATHCC